MWLPQAALGRIRELEAQLRDSVPRAVYDAALTRISEQERRIDWQCDMLLRRGQSLPLPLPPEEKPKPELQPQVSETDRVKAQVVIDQGKALNLPETDITEAVKSLGLGWTEADIAAAIHAPQFSSNGYG